MKRKYRNTKAIVWLTVAIYLSPPIAIAENQYLPVEFCYPRESSWCGPAALLYIINRYGIWPNDGGGKDGMCVITDYIVDPTSGHCCDDPRPTACFLEESEGITIEESEAALEHWGIDSDIIESELTIGECHTEISNGEPIYTRLYYSDDWGHFKVIVGDQVIGSAYNVCVINPSNGDTRGYDCFDYYYFLENDDWTWTHTIVLNEAPPGVGTSDDVVYLRSGSLDNCRIEDTWVFQTEGKIEASSFHVSYGDVYFVANDSQYINLSTGFHVETSVDSFNAYVE